MTLTSLFIVYGILMWIFISLDLGTLAVIATIITFLLLPFAAKNSDVEFTGNKYTEMYSDLTTYKNITRANPSLDIFNKEDKRR